MSLLWLVVVLIVLAAIFGGLFASPWLWLLIIVAVVVAATGPRGRV